MNLFRVFSLLALGALPVVAKAQPDPNNAPKGDNPQNRAVGGARNLTPEDRFKRQLVLANITVVAQQEAVITYIKGEMEAKQKLQQAALTLQTGIRNKNVTDTQVAAMLNDYNAIVSDDKARRQKALDTLKAAVNIAQFPRLESMLTLAGLYGDSPAVSSSGMTALVGGNNRQARGNNANGADRGDRGGRRAQGQAPGVVF